MNLDLNSSISLSFTKADNHRIRFPFSHNPFLRPNPLNLIYYQTNAIIACKKGGGKTKKTKKGDVVEW